MKNGIVMEKSNAFEAISSEDFSKPTYNANHFGAFGDMVFDNMPESLKAVAEAAERIAILMVLQKTNGNKSKTARILKIDRKTLYNKMRSYGIEK